jgi:hypothetical protein
VDKVDLGGHAVKNRLSIRMTYFTQTGVLYSPLVLGQHLLGWFYEKFKYTTNQF